MIRNIYLRENSTEIWFGGGQVENVEKRGQWRNDVDVEVEVDFYDTVLPVKRSVDVSVWVPVQVSAQEARLNIAADLTHKPGALFQTMRVVFFVIQFYVPRTSLCYTIRRM